MQTKQQYYGLDVLKFILAILVAARHVIQVFFTADSRAHILIGSWLSNLAVPSFFMISAFFLFQKVDPNRPDRGVIGRYCYKVLRLYVIWSVLYLPIDFYNWYHGQSTLWENVRYYIQCFFFSSSIVQLWYLPAMAVGCLIVWFLYTKRMRLWQILLITGLLFAIGVIGDNWYFNQQLPPRVYELLMDYCKVFITMRNGVFYGSFYAAIGLLFAKTKWRLPVWAAAVGAVCFIGLMYQEVVKCSSTNMVFTAAPAVYCLFTAVISLRGNAHVIFERLRGMSEWVYLSHFYFFYFFSWTRPWNPFPMTNKWILAMILGAILVFAGLMVVLAERKPFRWLKRLI